MQNKNEFILKAPTTLKFGLWTTPSLITGAADPMTFFTTINDCGYTRMGTLIGSIVDTFVEYLAGTPHVKIRKDMLQRSFGFKFTANQFNPILMTLIHNLKTISSTYTVSFIGHDTPVRPRYGWVIETKKVDGSSINIGMFSGEVVTPDHSMAFKGTEHVDELTEVEAFPSPDTALDEQSDYGAIWEAFTTSS